MPKIDRNNPKILFLLKNNYFEFFEFFERFLVNFGHFTIGIEYSKSYIYYIIHEGGQNFERTRLRNYKCYAYQIL